MPKTIVAISDAVTALDTFAVATQIQKEPEIHARMNLRCSIALHMAIALSCNAPNAKVMRAQNAATGSDMVVLIIPLPGIIRPIPTNTNARPERTSAILVSWGNKLNGNMFFVRFVDENNQDHDQTVEDCPKII